MLVDRYNELLQKFTALTDFDEKSLDQSKELFDFNANQIIPKRFEVYTLLAGLPLNTILSDNLVNLCKKISEIIGDKTKFYKVLPENYHWELFIVKRPTEHVSTENLQKAIADAGKIVKNTTEFDINYRGFLVTPDGTVIVKGIGEFDTLRSKLKAAVPYASQKQSNLGHISIGRILEPLGEEKFGKLKKLINQYTNKLFGTLTVDRVKYVHESQWYMVDKEVIDVIPLIKVHKPVAL